ncbi:MAG: EamA family transporter [Thermodesulfobacteriota bacterium]
MWILFSFLTALFEAGKDTLCKHALGSSREITVAWAWKVLSLPFLWPALLLIPWPKTLSPDFWMALAIGAGLNILATFMYIRAISSDDLSLTLPLLSFTPLFLLITSPLLVNESPTGISGYLGIVLIFCGSYVLGLGKKRGVLAPLKALFANSGPRWMLGVAALWSVAANMDKIGVKATSPFFWAVCVQTVIGAGITLTLLFARKRKMPTGEKSNPWPLFLIGLLTALGLLCQMTAIDSGIVPYVISIKRTSIFLGVLAGGFLFKEKEKKWRITGSICMLAGIFCIAAA